MCVYIFVHISVNWISLLLLLLGSFLDMAKKREKKKRAELFINPIKNGGAIIICSGKDVLCIDLCLMHTNDVSYSQLLLDCIIDPQKLFFMLQHCHVLHL